MTLSEELTWRGFVQDSTFSDLRQLDQGVITFYHGFDASAPSQTIGNLAAMMADKVFLRHGHKALILAGGATSLVGDPGGKDKERNIQTEDIIRSNIEAAQSELKKILVGHDFTMVNNLDWTRDMNVLTFLRDIGKHFSMTPLVQRDYIAERMGEGGTGITYTEFSYTLLQGMDYLHLFDTYGCTLQLGGSDQWGNCLSGVDLVRKARGAEVHALTLPLVINQETGRKFGKSEEGAVWLDAQKTTPYKFYQFWLNLSDKGIEGYLKVYTELSKEEIDQIIAEHVTAPHLRSAQRRLAEEVTRLVHGQDVLAAVQTMTQVVFGKNEEAEIGKDVADMILSDLQSIDHVRSEDIDIPQVLVDLELAESKGQARQFLKSGAIKFGTNGREIAEDGDIQADDVSDGRLVLVRRGKNSLGVIHLV